MEQLNKGVKSRLVDAHPDGLDICLHATLSFRRSAAEWAGLVKPYRGENSPVTS
jgi:hypothetical protein